MRNITTVELVRQMGLGINLGNTMEAVAPWASTVAQLETAWGSPTITKAIIQGYKAAGFDTLRIPVAWSNLMTMSTYTIHPSLLNRVQQIVDWTLEAGMYAIINLHWDGGWLEAHPTEYTQTMKRYTRIWEQVAERFKDYGDYVLFESQNEELGWDSVSKSRSYELVNEINQTFVDLVRASDGNNPQRHLTIAGYHTDINQTVDPRFHLPNDPRNRFAVKVHYYDPPHFAILGEEDEGWGPPQHTWGTPADHEYLQAQMDKLAVTFIGNGIPVVIGEYGPNPLRGEVQIRGYTLAVTEAMFSRGMLPILWDTQQGVTEYNAYYNRRTRTMTDSVLEAGMKAIAASR